MFNYFIFASLLICGYAVAEPGFVDTRQKVIYPVSLAGLDYRYVKPQDEPETGYRLKYSNEGTTVDVIVSAPTTSVNGGLKSEAITAAITSFRDELETKKANGEYLDVKDAGAAIVPKEGNVRFRMAAFKLSQKTPNAVAQLYTTLYVTVCRDLIFQLTLTFPEENRAQARTVHEKLTEEMAAILETPVSQKELILALVTICNRDPMSYAGRSAAQFLVEYAQTNEEVTVNIYPHLLPWLERGQAVRGGELIVCAYAAGVLEYLYKNDLKMGGEVQGFEHMLRVYKKLREKESVDRISELETWASNPDPKALFEELLVQ